MSTPGPTKASAAFIFVTLVIEFVTGDAAVANPLLTTRLFAAIASWSRRYVERPLSLEVSL